MSTARRTTSVRRHLALNLGRLLVLSSATSVLVLAHLGTASANTSNFRLLTERMAYNQPNSVAVADFNGDGHLDTVTAGWGVTINTGSAGGTPDSSNVVYDSDEHGESIAVDDFDADGNPDVVVLTPGLDQFGAGQVSVLLGNPDGTLGDVTRFAAGNGPASLTVGDVNGDGDPDLAVTNLFDATVSILLGESGGTFGAPTAFPAGDFPYSAAIGNFDGDADPDLVLGSADGELTVLLGNGDGSFDAPNGQKIGTDGEQINSIAIGDFNGDSDPDLAAVGLNRRILMLLGAAGGTFTPTATYETGRSLHDVAVADFNNDSHSDLVLGGTPFGVGVLHGAGDGTFEDFKDFHTYAASFSVAVGDFNSDLKPDIVAANLQSSRYTTGGITVLLNTSETIPPETTITGGPSGLTYLGSPTFTFTSDESGSTFECRRDVDEAFESCTSPWQFPHQVSDGPHTFQVRATDASGNVDPTPAGRDYVVDTTPPAPATFTAGPSGLTTDSTPTFEFESSETHPTFQCKIDDEPYVNCESPFTTAELPDGEHTVSIRVFDEVGHSQPGWTTRTFTIDTDAPDTSITAGPDAVTADGSPTFTFTSDEPEVTFECRLDGPNYTPCSSPFTSEEIALDRDYGFEVRAKDGAGNVDPTPAIRPFRLDRTAPVTAITSGPGTLTTDNTPTFGFKSSEPGSTFECRVDDAAFTACTSTHTTAQLDDGPHTFEVRSTDGVGNVDPRPAVRPFTVDTVAPDTTLAEGPSGLINDNTPSFAWDFDEARYECRVDDEPFATCRSPYTTATLGDGDHTFELRSFDTAGNVDPTPAKRTFTIDTSAQVTSITGGPSGLIDDSTPTFTFATSDPDSTFECRVSPGSFTACTSPYTSSALPDGEHTFWVRSIDPAGNVESPAIGRTITVDTLAPDTSIDDGPTGTIHEATPTFGFGSSDSEATLECRVDDEPFGPCASPYTTAPLDNGSHTFQARATDEAGNADATPASRSFTVSLDTTAPKTRIDSGPANLTNHVDATFAFSADEPATFECKLDAGSFAPCESGDSYGPLGEGSHSFAVRATDTAGNIDSVPATRTWMVDTTPPKTTITSGPPSLTLSNKATLAFTSSEGGSHFECRLDGGDWAACTNPRTYTGVRLGNHTVSVRAIDPAGNTDSTPAEATWFTLGLLPF